MTDPARPDTGLADLAEALLRAAARAGADAADALAVRGEALSVDIRQGKLEQAERAEGTEVGLRVILGQRQACVSASDTSEATLERLAERAVAMAREAPEDSSIGLAAPQDLAQGWDLAALDLTDDAPEPGAPALETAARALEAAALAQPGITQASASASWSHRALALAQSNGFRGGYGRTGHSRSIVAFCGSGTLGVDRRSDHNRLVLCRVPGRADRARHAGARPRRATPRRGNHPTPIARSALGRCRARRHS